jgi:hypothetical protein
MKQTECLQTTLLFNILFIKKNFKKKLKQQETKVDSDGIPDNRTASKNIYAITLQIFMQMYV